MCGSPFEPKYDEQQRHEDLQIQESYDADLWDISSTPRGML